MTAATASRQARGENGSAPVRNVPHNIDAERSVLGSIMLDNDQLGNVMHVLTPQMFYQPSHQLVFEAMLALSADSRPVDLTTLVDRLKRQGDLDKVDGYVYLASLEQFVLATSAARHHAEIVREKAQLRELLDVARRIATKAMDEDLAPEDVARLGHDGLFRAMNGSRQQRIESNETLGPRTIEHIREAKRRHDAGEIIGTPTGLADLDRLTGGINEGELVYLAARPSIGKTAFGLQIQQNQTTITGAPVPFFSLEMSNLSIYMRALCAHAGIDLRRARTGTLKDWEVEALAKAEAKIRPAPGIYNDCASLSAAQFAVQARILKTRYPDMPGAIIDGLWLMTHPEGERDDVRIGHTSRLLKQTAKELGIWVLCLHQLNRKAEDRATVEDRKKNASARPTLADLRGTGAAEQDADMVWFIHRERVKEEVEDDEGFTGTGRAVPTEVIVAKARNGPIGDVTVNYFLRTQKIANAAREVGWA